MSSPFSSSQPPRDPSPARDPQDSAQPDPHVAREPRLQHRRAAPTRRDDERPDERTSRERTQPKLFARLAHLRRTQAKRERGQQQRNADSQRLRWALRGVLSVAVLLLLLAGLTTLWLRHSLHAALPTVDGELRVPGLLAPVSVTRDAKGVPSITAANMDDLLVAQGFVTAQDRLWQMDALRRHAAGDLAEILGPSLVEHDREQRFLQLRNAADRGIAALPPAELHQLDQYARGVNAFLAANGNRLPIEFHVLHYTPAPWSPRDSMLVALAMAEDLSEDFPNKLSREALGAHLPAALMADLYPVGSWRDRPPVQTDTDLTAPKDAIEQIPLDRSQSRLRAPAVPSPGTASAPDATALLARNESLRGSVCPDCVAGSNSWAVAASHSASGAPLLSNDMHLSLSAPDIWYETQLHTVASSAAERPLDLAGFNLPGLPFVSVGRNAHVAWGFTNVTADVQDVRVEHLRGAADNTEFQQPNGVWSPVGHHPEHIRVRGGRDVSFDVLTTTHAVGNALMETPVISSLYKGEGRALSLAWTVYDPTSLHIPFGEVAMAADGPSLVAAFASLGTPALNLMYADDSRHIGFHVLGRFPVRGPAIQRPRQPQPFELPDNTPPADEEDENGGPEARLQPLAGMEQPHLLAAAFHPARARRPRRAPQAARPIRHPRERTPVPTEAAPAITAAPILPPVRKLDYVVGSPIPLVPIDALDPAAEWTAYVPYGELPSVLDPPAGFVATANARITPDDYPYALATDWVDPYRVERIGVLLSHRSGLTPADMLAIQTDTHSEFDLLVAQRLAYALDHASPGALAKDTVRLHGAADLLRAFKGDMAPGSAAAAITYATREALWPMLLTAALRAHDGSKLDEAHALDLAQLYSWHERNTALELLLQHTPARWLPHGYRNWDDLLTAAVLRGLQQFGAPVDLARWQYGTIDPVEIAHPVFNSHSIVSVLLGVRTGTGLQPDGGDMTTVKAAGLHFGPSERFTADLSGPEGNTANVTTGQSGNPASPLFLDQFPAWLAGTTFPFPLHAGESVHTLRLTP